MRFSCLPFALGLSLALCCISGCASKDDADPFHDMSAAERFEDYVPPTSKIVAEGTGKLSYAPTEVGTLYLVDLDDMRRVKDASKPHVLMTGTPAPGPEITFDPATGQITRAGKSSVKLKNVVAGHRHQLRFQPGKQDKSGQNPK